MVREHGANRVLFGSDSPWGGQAETLVIDMAEDDGADINISDLPAGTVYMDMGSKEKKRRQILKRNKNIRYLSVPRSLPQCLSARLSPRRTRHSRINLPVLSLLWSFGDMGSKEKKRRQILKRNKNIRYLSPEGLLNKWCHLDTNVQNGYNTRVN